MPRTSESERRPRVCLHNHVLKRWGMWIMGPRDRLGRSQGGPVGDLSSDDVGPHELHGRILYQQKHCQPGLKETETGWNKGRMNLKVAQRLAAPWPPRAATQCQECRATPPFLMRPEGMAFSQKGLVSSLKLGICPAGFQTWLRTVTLFSLWFFFWERGMYVLCLFHHWFWK